MKVIESRIPIKMWTDEGKIMKTLTFITLISVSIITIASASKIEESSLEKTPKRILVKVTVPYEYLNKLATEEEKKKASFNDSENKEPEVGEPAPEIIQTIIIPQEEIVVVEQKSHHTPLAVTASSVKTVVAIPQKTVHVITKSTPKVVKKVFKKRW